MLGMQDSRGTSPQQHYEQNIQGFVFELGYFSFESGNWDHRENKVYLCLTQALYKAQWWPG
jgi:hypothetical protein